MVNSGAVAVTQLSNTVGGVRVPDGFADADRSPGLLLWQVTNRWQAAQRATLAPVGLTHVQFVLLASLTWLARDAGSGLVMQRDLADHAATDPAMTSQVLRALELKGLVERAPHPTDRRAKAIRPTFDGDLANRAVVLVEGCDAEFFGALGAGADDLVRALLTLREAAS